MKERLIIIANSGRLNINDSSNFIFIILSQFFH
jgi:hypothetical protein